MKLYDYPKAPNPRRVNIFLTEKGIEIERIQVDLIKQEQLKPEYYAKNPACDVPMLELDDGTCISQIPAIYRYFEEIEPNPPLLGSTPREKALCAMWEHLVFMNGLLAIAEVFRNTTPGFTGRAVPGPHSYEQSPEMAERGLSRVRNFFSDFDQQLSNNEYVAGDFYSVADITTLVTCDFAKWIKQDIPAECTNLSTWYKRLSERAAIQANPG